MAVLIKWSATVWASSTEILAADNKGRKIVIITNDSDSTIYLSFDEDAVLNQGIPLGAGSSYINTWETEAEMLMVQAQINWISSWAWKNVSTQIVDLKS